MYIVNEDKSIYVTRGDAVILAVGANNNGVPYVFQPGEVVRFRVFEKKGCHCTVLQKDFIITDAVESVDIVLTKEETRIGEIISKPKDYWYEIELNPDYNPQTIVGYNDDGPKVFRLFPEGADTEGGEGEAPDEFVPAIEGRYLPYVTEEDNGKTVAVVDGDWRLVESGIEDIESRGGAVCWQDVDDKLLDSSTNLVRNKAVANAIHRIDDELLEVKETIKGGIGSDVVIDTNADGEAETITVDGTTYDGFVDPTARAEIETLKENGGLNITVTGDSIKIVDDGMGNVSFTTINSPDEPDGCVHTYTVTATTEPTCGTDGVRTYTCSKCGYTDTEVIPATGNHMYDDDDDAECNVCGHIRDVECDHEYNAVVTAPTCTTGGYTTHTCTKCGDTYVDDYTDALGHTYDDDSDAVCNVCGHEREVDVPDEPTQEVLAFDWEIGDLTAAGKELGPAAPYNTVLRTVDGYQLPYNAVTVTPADGYKVGYKEFNTANCAEGTVTNVKAASPDPYTFNPNPNCYYRFVIASTTSGTVANENWHTNVTIVGVTEVTPTTFALRRTVVADEIEDAGELQSLTVNKRKYSSFHDKGAHNRIDELKTQIERVNGIIGSNWEWEQGDVKTNGSLADSTTLWRTVEYINLGEYDSVVVTPSNGYKCGYRAFIKSGDTYTIVSGGSNTATTEPFTITPDPTYYYRFVIASTTSGEIADDTWDNNVTFKVGTGGTTDNTATAEEILAPDYEVIALPSAVGEWQDIVKVGNELWLCDESTTVHGSLDGYIYRLNASDFSYIGAFKHNLGHLNSVDYDADNDRLITGSASNASTETPKIWIFENVLAWTELPDGAELTYASLDATEIDLSADISANSSYINTCWGERNSAGNHSVYVNANLGAQWLKIYPTISGGQYKGAYTVGWEKTYTKQNIPNNTQAQVVQGMDLYNGRIIAALTHTPITCAMMHFNASDKATRTIIQMDWGTTGAMEGLTVIDGYIYGGISQVRKLAKFKV